MMIETKNKTINLVLKTRKIVDIANLLKNKNFEEAFIKAYSILDGQALTKIIFKLAENDNGESARIAFLTAVFFATSESIDIMRFFHNSSCISFHFHKDKDRFYQLLGLHF